FASEWRSLLRVDSAEAARLQSTRRRYDLRKFCFSWRSSAFGLQPVNVLQRSFDRRRSGQIPRDRVIEGLLHRGASRGIEWITARHHDGAADQIEGDTEPSQREIIRQHPGQLPIEIVIFERDKCPFRPINQYRDNLVDLVGVLPAQLHQQRSRQRLPLQVLVPLLHLFQCRVDRLFRENLLDDKNLPQLLFPAFVQIEPLESPSIEPYQPAFAAGYCFGDYPILQLSGKRL